MKAVRVRQWACTSSRHRARGRCGCTGAGSRLRTCACSARNCHLCRHRQTDDDSHSIMRDHSDRDLSIKQTGCASITHSAPHVGRTMYALLFAAADRAPAAALRAQGCLYTYLIFQIDPIQQHVRFDTSWTMATDWCWEEKTLWVHLFKNYTCNAVAHYGTILGKLCTCVPHWLMRHRSVVAPGGQVQRVTLQRTTEPSARDHAHPTCVECAQYKNLSGMCYDVGDGCLLRSHSSRCTQWKQCVKMGDSGGSSVGTQVHITQQKRAAPLA